MVKWLRAFSLRLKSPKFDVAFDGKIAIANPC